MPTAARTAAIYVRQSQDQTGEGLGVARQEKECRDRAEALGWPVAEVYTDNDVSATKRAVRPAYQRLLADIEAGTRDAVIVWDLDRLHRKPAELEHFIDLADTHKVKLANVSGEVDLSTATGRLTARIKGSVAANEGEQKSARIQAKNRQLAAAGTFSNATDPFGWRGMELVPAEADLIRHGIESLLKGGSMAGVTADFNASGIKPRRVDRWSRRTVWQTLTRPRNAGIVVLRGEEVGDAQWDAIVSKETHRAVCDLLKDPDRRSSPGNTRTLLLSGLLTCGSCGKQGFVGATHLRPDSGNRRLLYRCNKCYGTVIRRDLADETVTDWIATELAQDTRTLWNMTGQGVMDEITKNRKRVSEIRADEAKLAKADISFDLRLQWAEDLKAKRHQIDLELQRLVQRDAITSLILDLAPEDVFTRYSGTEYWMPDPSRPEVRAPAMLSATEDNKKQVRARFEALPLDRRQTVIRAMCKITILSGTEKRTADAQKARIKMDPTLKLWEA